MKTILLAVVLVAAPAFAQQYPGDDDYSWQSSDEDAPPPPEPDSYAGDYAPPDSGPTMDDFRNDAELSWNGEWIDTPEYGTVWRPTRVNADWQPYYNGRWTWTRAGWAWVSEEGFGWAVYHYGRWGWSPAMGWYWLPGRVWAPAWVAWRSGDGYTGWCALGPRGTYARRPQRWVWVGQQHFLEPVRHHVVPLPRVWEHNDARPMVGPRAGPPIAVIERATGRTVRPVPVTEVPTARAATSSSSGVGFYRPRTAPVAMPSRTQPAAPRAAPPHPVYFGGVPTENRGGPARPHAAGPASPAPQGQVPAARPQAAQAPPPEPKASVPHARPSDSGQDSTRAKER